MSTRRGSSYPAAFERRLKPIREEPSTKKVVARSPAPQPSAWSAGQPKVAPKPEVKPQVAPKPEVHAPPSRPVEVPSTPYVDLPWPETDDFGTPQSLSPEFPKEALDESEVKRLGDVISGLIDAEIKMCRETSATHTHIQLYPSPPYQRALNSYVTEKVKERFSVDIDWKCGRDVITIVF